MQKINGLTAAIQNRIKTARKAPRIKKSALQDAAINSMSPLTVTSRRVFQHPEIAHDGNALLVYMAIANHANKAGMTSCSQQRIADITGLSVRTIARKLDKLRAVNLIKKEYQRPVNGDPYRRLNIMRIVYDDGTMTRHDVRSIAQETDQKRHPLSDNSMSGNNAQSVDNSVSDHSTTGQTVVMHGPDNQAGTLPDKQTSSIIGQTNVTDKQAKALNNYGHANTDYTHDDIIKIWRASVRVLGAEAIPTEADHETIEHLRAKGASLQAIRGEISDYCLEAQERQEPAPARLRSIVAPLLAIR